MWRWLARAELMAELDQNQDGEVDFEEFCNGWERIFIVGTHDDGKAPAGGGYPALAASAACWYC